MEIFFDFYLSTEQKKLRTPDLEDQYVYWEQWNRFEFCFLGLGRLNLSAAWLSSSFTDTLARGTTSGVNFIDVLHIAFTIADPKSAKKTVKLSVFFELSGSVWAKAALETLMKLTPGYLQSSSTPSSAHPSSSLPPSSRPGLALAENFYPRIPLF